MTRGRVIVAMSGGVDSSVAALLLKEQGYEVIGITMRLWTVEKDDIPSISKRCCSVEDISDARQVCQTIGAPHYVQNFEQEFQEHVVKYFVQEYDRGRTPHPCLACNDKIKFDFLLRRALFLDADYIATGHYSRIQKTKDGFHLLKGVDTKKDQSYVLFTLNQKELSRMLLPVGEYPKDEIRKIASDAGLPVADKPDSQEICFIPDGNYRKFLKGQTIPKAGDFVDTKGEVIGRHPGTQFFTIGQRRNLGLQAKNGSPHYVIAIDPDSNQVTLGPENALNRNKLWVSRLNFVGEDIPTEPVSFNAKIRYKASEAKATLFITGDCGEVHFEEPQRAITPGQAIVFYKDDRVIGGGYIEVKPPYEITAKTSSLTGTTV